MWFCIGIMVGIAGLQQLSHLPSIWIVSVFFVLPIIFWRCCRKMAFLMLGIGLGLSYALWQAHIRLSDKLPLEQEGKDVALVFRVSTIPQCQVAKAKFDAEVLQSSKKTPKSIRIFWQLNSPKACLSLFPGQVWRANVTLRRAHSLMNIGGFDQETYYFRENIHALATIKGEPKQEKALATAYTAIQKWRQNVRESMRTYLENKSYGPVLIALVMGDQAGISREDWDLFQKTGLTHLVSISGSHITMLSACCIGVILFLGRWIKGVSPDNLRRVAFFLGLLLALGYCLLAGWGIPAQRTFLMLSSAFLREMGWFKWSFWQTMTGAALMILCVDPWATLSPGFYLSFFAVMVLHQVTTEKTKPFQSMMKIQVMISLALLPLCMFFFQQISLNAPVVNAYAIFLIGAVITPLSLLWGMLSVILENSILVQALADLTHFLLEKTLQLSAWLVTFPYSVLDVPSPSWWAMGVMLSSLVWILWGKGKWRYLSFSSFLLPFWQIPLEKGEWRAIAFDIGQGGAILVQTTAHTLLFDTGLRYAAESDSAQRVLLPAFRALGVSRLDNVVISHADLDHSAGLANLVSSLPIGQVYASFQVDQFLDQQERTLGKTIESVSPQLRYAACHEGVSFELDGVKFLFLNAKIKPLPFKSRNEQSCVLAIHGQYHRALLTGDIHEEQERNLLQHKDFSPPYTVVQVPHHGSRTSSSHEFVRRLQAQLAFAQTGHKNRYGHPHVEIQKRWEAQKSLFLNTAKTGSIQMQSQEKGFSYALYREEKRRYWHDE